MKKTSLFAVSVLLWSAQVSFSQNVQAPQDTTLTGEEIEEVVVVARVEQPTDNRVRVDQRTLNLTNNGQNLPYLLSSTPSLVVTSDDGLGIGYTYFRVRGTDQSRINMTINDVPLNDQESQTVFWVNMTDFASGLKSLDIQRGVGTSTNGSSAFGASLNMSTLDKTVQPSHVTLSFNGGMYNTFREQVSANVALSNHWQAEARFSKVNSDGYLERAFSDLYSYSGSVGYYGAKTKAVLSVFGGKEKTYMAWNGVSWDDLQTRPRYNPAGKYTDDEGNKVYYPNQTDNYAQQHAQFHLTQTLLPRLLLDATLYYTHGGGYYEQYKAGKSFTAFGLQPYTDADGNTVEESDFINRKNLNNHFAGTIVSLRWFTDPVDAQFSAAANTYHGDHWGNVIYVRDSLYPHPVPYDYEYYRSVGNKTDANIFAKANWRIINRQTEKLILYADLQYRYVHYAIDGINDEDLRPIPVEENFHFFNPKAGLTYTNGGHNTYFNFAIANREPQRKNYTEAGVNDIPCPERLYDYELGYTYTHEKFTAGVNLYYMDYYNQLVLTGKYSSTTGAYLTRNVDRSYRMGIEMGGHYAPVNWFSWSAALTLSRNKIQNYVDWVELYDMDWNKVRDADGKHVQVETSFGKTTIAMSPSVIFNNTFTFQYAGFRGDIQTSVVSKQYLDNTMSEEAILPTYTVTNLTLQYLLPLPTRWPDITLRCQLNNLFNTRYASHGGSWMCQFTDGSRYYDPWYYAQAGINVHGGISVTF